MSQGDGFIDEVTDAVRRDRLFAILRRWAWVGVLAVVLIVGGTVYQQWSAARGASAAEARGDALQAAFAAGDAEAASSVEAQGVGAAVVALLAAGADLAAEEGGDASSRLAAMAADEALPPRYRDLAALKLAMASSDASVNERRAMLEPLALGPYRLLAAEQLALLDVELGDRDAAIERLSAILDDVAASQGLRARAEQLITALGGADDAA